RGNAEQREREREHVRALAVFDERDEAPGRRNERARKGRAVGPDRWERVRERRQQKERSRTEKGRAARTRQRPGREVQSGKPDGSKGIDGKATRQGARLDAPSMGPRA